MPSAKHRRSLDSFKTVTPTLWYEAVIGTINNVSAKLAGECATMLMQNGKLDLLRETLARLISQHQASSEILLWLAKERSDTFADILGPEVFRAMVSAIERDTFNEKKSNKLRDFILADLELLPELIASADIEVVKDLTRALQLSSSFDDMDRRSLLARIVKVFPAVKELITGEAVKQDHGFIVSWSSLERRRAEDERDQPHWPGRLKGVVGEEPVVAQRDAQARQDEEQEEEARVEQGESGVPQVNGHSRQGHDRRAQEEHRVIPIDPLPRHLRSCHNLSFVAHSDETGGRTQAQITELLPSSRTHERAERLP